MDIPTAKIWILDNPFPNDSCFGYPASIFYDFKTNKGTYNISAQFKISFKLGYLFMTQAWDYHSYTTDILSCQP